MAKIKAFPTILKVLALDYYYSNINISSAISFDQIFNSTRNYFESGNYKQSIISK